MEKGIRTGQDVAQRFGAPNEIVQANGHENFHYCRHDIKLDLLLFMSRMNVANDNLWVFMNQQGIVEDVVYGNRADELSFQVLGASDDISEKRDGMVFRYRFADSQAMRVNF